MAKPDPVPGLKERSRTIRCVVTIFLVTIVVSGVISLISDGVMENSGMAVAFLILLTIVMVGIIFDICGVAVTSADEKPFHSMAARKVPGAKESIKLLRNAERVSSICNDVVGDICGVVSGSASATIAVQVMQYFTFSTKQVIPLAMSAMVAGLAVGGKAIGKTFAVHSCTNIVYGVGKRLYWIHHPSELFHKDR